MAIIENGNFSLGLDHWEVVPDYWAEEQGPGQPALVRIATPSLHPTGTASPSPGLYVEAGRYVSIRQTFPTGAITDYTHMYMRFYAEAASFYVNLHFDDGSEGTHFYGHWARAWRDEWIPISMGRRLMQFEILIESALNLYIDDILIPGDRVEPKFGFMREKIPEEIDELRKLQAPMERRMLGIERELKQITALLSKQQDPDINKKVKAVLDKRKTKK